MLKKTLPLAAAVALALSTAIAPVNLLEKPGGCPQEVYEVMLMCWADEPKDRATFERLQDVLSLLIQK